MVGVAVACGLAGAFAAVVFRLMIRTVTAIFFEGSAGVQAIANESLLAEAMDPLETARR